jgi:hypothetical protein
MTTVSHHSIARTATRYIKSLKSKPVLKPLIARSTAVPAAPRFRLAKASSSSSIFCFAQADAFSVGDDRICIADQSQLVVASVSKPDRRVYARRPAAFTGEARRFSSACRINRSSISV